MLFVVYRLQIYKLFLNTPNYFEGKIKKDNLCSCAPCYNFVTVNHNYSLKLNAYENKKNQELQEFG